MKDKCEFQKGDVVVIKSGISMNGWRYAGLVVEIALAGMVGVTDCYLDPDGGEFYYIPAESCEKITLSDYVGQFFWDEEIGKRGAWTMMVKPLDSVKSRKGFELILKKKRRHNNNRKCPSDSVEASYTHFNAEDDELPFSDAETQE